MNTSEAEFDTPGIYGEACEYGLTRGTCFVARPLEVAAVAVLLCIYFVLCFEWWYFVIFFRFLYFERTRPAASTYEAPLPHFPLY